MSTDFSWDPRTWGTYVANRVEKAAEAVAEVVVEEAVKSGVVQQAVKAVAASGVLDQLAVNTPQYREYQREVRAYAEPYESYATAGMYTSIVGATVGVCLTLAGRNKSGYTLVIVSVPMGYFSYNANQVYGNLQDKFAKRLIQHMYREDGKDKIDAEKLKETLKKGTVCYDPFIEFHAEHFITHIASLEEMRGKQLLSQ